MQYRYKTKLVCSKEVRFDLEDNGTIRNISFLGGCDGNLQGIASLAEGMNADEVVKRMKGIKCGWKKTSCPDQLANAIEEAQKNIQL